MKNEDLAAATAGASPAASSVEHKPLSERQFNAIARSQNDVRDAENAAVEAQKTLSTTRQEAEEIFALICEAKGIPEGSNVQLDIQSRQLVVEVKAKAPSAPAQPALP
jgi:hypothetical protein